MSGFAEYESYDALGLAELVRAGEVSATEVLEAAIARVEARNPAVNAVVTKLYDHAAQAIEAGLPEGPFTGVPYLLKALFTSLAGVGCAHGSRFFADLPPATDDSLHVARLKQAGMVIYGMTSSCEMGLSLTCEPQLHGPSRNPWDLERTPAGSSGGAGAAVGARMLPIAHASDGFGSIRAPAASCGLVGLRPTRARTNLAPALGEALAGLAIEHAVSLTVRDNAALLMRPPVPPRAIPIWRPLRPARSLRKWVPIPARCASRSPARRRTAPRWRPTRCASCKRPRRSAQISAIGSTRPTPRSKAPPWCRPSAP